MSCEKCPAMCCRHIALGIDAPKDKDDWDNIRWYVAHEKTRVWMTAEGDWHIEFITPCKHIAPDNKCMIYEKRPNICREYSSEDCVFNCKEDEDMLTFTCVEDVDRYLAKHPIPDERP